FTGIDLNLSNSDDTPLTLDVEADDDTIDITTGKTPLAPANITRQQQQTGSQPAEPPPLDPLR
ncbi:MAG: hypothetical protein ABFS46_08550, partial [Myxococcota bacterium]